MSKKNKKSFLMPAATTLMAAGCLFSAADFVSIFTNASPVLAQTLNDTAYKEFSYFEDIPLTTADVEVVFLDGNGGTYFAPQKSRMQAKSKIAPYQPTKQENVTFKGWDVAVCDKYADNPLEDGKCSVAVEETCKVKGDSKEVACYPEGFPEQRIYTAIWEEKEPDESMKDQVKPTPEPDEKPGETPIEDPKEPEEKPETPPTVDEPKEEQTDEVKEEVKKESVEKKDEKKAERRKDSPKTGILSTVGLHLGGLLGTTALGAGLFLHSKKRD